MNKSQTAPGDNVLDAAFFRAYQDLADPDKERVREIVEAWAKKE
jgi:hypothetical protein